jgi:hypothetical protein
MSRAPKTSVIQRLFVSVDKSWRGNDFTLITVKPYAAEAVKALNCMIPECLHYYGEEAVKAWHSNAGLLAYKNVNWDPTKQSTTSHQDYATQALVEEDLFQIGSNWKMEAPIMQPQANCDKQQAQQKNYTVENLLASRNTDTNVRSFGSAFGRDHDADSVVSEKKIEEPPITVIQTNPTLLINEKENQDDMSFDASATWIPEPVCSRVAQSDRPRQPKYFLSSKALMRSIVLVPELGTECTGMMGRSMSARGTSSLMWEVAFWTADRRECCMAQNARW